MSTTPWAEIAITTVSPTGTPSAPTWSDSVFSVAPVVFDVAPIAPTRLGTTGAVTVKSFTVQPVPPGVVTQTFPVFAPVGTVAVIEVFESTLNAVAAVALKVTTVAPVRSVPEIVTWSPTWPEPGVTSVTVGVGGGGGSAGYVAIDAAQLR